jgi:benzoyl-CoA-dihydrodiol lyase
MSAVPEPVLPEPRTVVNYDTHPDRYVHWRLAFDGPIATSIHGRRRGQGHQAGYRLKLNSTTWA